jgi:hypothetical protein
MKKVLITCLGSMLALLVSQWELTGAEAKTPSGALFRLHSGGGETLAAGTNAAQLQLISGLPETRTLRGLVLDKLAGVPFRIWQSQLPKGASNQVALLRPLLDDLAAFESYVQVDGPTNAIEMVAAVHLNDQRAGLWSKNLSQLLAAWQMGQIAPLATNGFTGWETKTGPGHVSIRFLRAGSWILLDESRQNPKLFQAVVEAVRQTGRPVASLKGDLLEVEIDAPRLAAWIPFLARYPFGVLEAAWSGEGEFLRTQAKMDFDAPLKLVLDPWQVPTNLINDPLDSFTAARGVQPLLSRFQSLGELGLKPIPNQFYVWGQRFFNGQTLLAVPNPDPTNALKRMLPHVPKFINGLLGKVSGEIGWATNTSEIVWRGLPFLMPFISPILDGRERFLLTGMIPYLGKTNPPPAALYDQFIGRKDMVYYDWEITQERAVHHRHYYRLADIITRHQTLPDNAPAIIWFQEAHQKLGNTVTEISLAGPQRLSLVRKSHLGVTGFELVTLLRWIDSPGFPLTFVSQPFLPSKPPKRPPPGRAPKRKVK